MDKTTKAMVRKSRELPFPEPAWLRNSMAISTILQQKYSEEIRGMVDVYQVGKEEIGSILCIDAQGKGDLLLGKECRGKSGFVVVKDCKSYGIAVGTLHTHPAMQPCLSPQDLENGIPSTFFSCLTWKDIYGQYMLKTVTLDTYFFKPYNEQVFIDTKINEALNMEEEMHFWITNAATIQEKQAISLAYLQNLVALCTYIERMLGSYTVQLL
jgi:hypothetical protein